MQKVHVQVDNDHLKKLTKTSPVTAIAELIWNSLDADADSVEVNAQRNTLNGIETLRVVDNGHGISHIEVATGFGYLGGSWKKNSQQSRFKRESCMVKTERDATELSL